MDSNISLFATLVTGTQELLLGLSHMTSKGKSAIMFTVKMCESTYCVGYSHIQAFILYSCNYVCITTSYGKEKTSIYVKIVA